MIWTLTPDPGARQKVLAVSGTPRHQANAHFRPDREWAFRVFASPTGGDARIGDPEQRRLIEEAAAAERHSVSAFVVDTVVRARSSAAAEHAPRPVGGWSFVLAEGWEGQLDDFAAWRLPPGCGWSGEGAQHLGRALRRG